MLKEFREFIDRGNVVDLAVAVIIGAAFSTVVTSFVNDVLMQIVSAIAGKPDFSDLTVVLKDTPIRYGSFLTALINFLLIATSVFLVVKAMNKAREFAARNQEAEEEALEATEVELLAEIRDLLQTRA